MEFSSTPADVPSSKVLPLARILTAPVLTVAPGVPVREALQTMQQARVSALVVCEHERPVGIITERDAVLLVSRHGDATSLAVADIMGHPPVTALPGMDYRDAYRLIADRGVRHLIVVDGKGRLVGIVTEGDFLDHLGYEYLVRLKEVGAVMTREVLTLGKGASLDEAVQLMASRGVSCVVVTEGQQPLGMLTERDVVRLAERNVDIRTPLSAVMSSPVQTVGANDSLEDTVRRMNDSRIRRVAVVDGVGELVGLVTHHDVTKVLYGRHIEHLQQTIATLRAELAGDPDRLYQYLMEHSADGVAVVDVRDGRILRANEQLCQMLGYAIDTLLALRVPDFSLLYGAVRWEDQIAQYRRVGGGVVEAEHRRADGSLLPVEVSIRYVEGEPDDYLVAIIRDISERKAAERIRRAQERHFREMDRIAAILGEGELETVLAKLVDEIRRIFDADRAWLVQVVGQDTAAQKVHFESTAPGFPGVKSEGEAAPADELARALATKALASLKPEILDMEDPAVRASSWVKRYSIRAQMLVALRPLEEYPWLLGLHRCRSDEGWDEDDRRLFLAVGERTAEALGRLMLTRRLQDDIVARRRSQDELAERETQLRTLIEAVPDAISFKDGEGRWLIANGVNLRQFDVAEHEWHGLSDDDLAKLHPDKADALHTCRITDEAAWRSGGQFRTEEATFAPDGSRRHFDVIKVPLFNEDGSRRALVVIGRDITERRETEEALRRAASVFRSTHEGITITAPDGTIVDVNESFCRITGYSRDEAIGQNPRLLRSGQHAPEFYAQMWSAIVGEGHWSGEIWNRRKDGSIYPELLTISAVRDGSGVTTGYVGVFTDITLLKQHERQLERIAHYDALTGVPNRLLLADRMQQAIAQTRRAEDAMAVGYLDLDGFKPINDRLGHDVGDRLLMEIARRLRAVLRDGDTVARLGGDEFVVLLLGLERASDCAVALTRVLSTITEPIQIDDHLVTISASIGATLYPLDDADPDTLLRHADQAMYEAKQGGRNRYQLYDPEHDRRTRSHHEAFARIRLALANREFELFYQPKVNMRHGMVVGAEALIRWRHPDRGLLSPGEFLPIIESSELEIELGEWVLQTALEQLAAWAAAGFDWQVSVNIAASHLQHPEFAPRLGSLLAQCNGYARLLQLEVLETAALEDIARVSETIEACQALGVSFALDDFGTGYSSLTYLKRLRAEVLKIDQSFVRDMLVDPEDRAIVAGVIGMTRAFGRTPVAEGVETVEHGLMLLDHDCELAQGYGIARPMPAPNLPEWAQGWRADPRWLRR